MSALPSRQQLSQGSLVRKVGYPDKWLNEAEIP